MNPKAVHIDNSTIGNMIENYNVPLIYEEWKAGMIIKTVSYES